MKLKDIEKAHILVSLERAKWNRTHTARQLGIGLRTLQRKLVRYEKEGAVILNNPVLGVGRAKLHNFRDESSL